jgi:multicomponent K+:H+ antiporter subunit G
MNGAMPLWVDVLSAVLVVTGALATLIGSLGVLRLGSFFQRVHAPTLGSTLGVWSFILATVLQISFARGQLFIHALLIAVFIALTAPVTTLLLMRAAVFRSRLKGTDASIPGVNEHPVAPRGLDQR